MGSRLAEINLRPCIGAVGNHDAHRNAEGKEQLAHSIKGYLQEAPHGHSGKVRRNIKQETLPTGAGNTGCIGMNKCQSKARHSDNRQQQHRHYKGGCLLNTLFYTEINNQGGSRQKNR